MIKNIEKSNAILNFKEGLTKAITEYLSSVDTPTKKLIGFEFDQEKRTEHAIDNALFTLLNWDVGLLENINIILKEHAKSNKYRQTGFLSKQVEGYVSNYQHEVEKAHIHTKSFIEEVRIMFRSTLMVMETVGFSGTHHEKDARMRGLCGYLQGMIDKVENTETNYILSDYHYRSIFKSEYPMRHMIDKMNELKQENKDLKRQINGDNETNKSDDFAF